MKLLKSISLILTICFIFGSFPIAISASGSSVETVFDSAEKLDFVKVYPSNVKKGDLDGSGSLNSRDYSMLKRFLVGDASYPERLAVDINGDGKVSSKDSVSIKKILGGTTDISYFGNATVEKAFDVEESSLKLTEKAANSSAAFYDIDIRNITGKYVVAVMKGTDNCAFNVANSKNDLTPALSCTKVEGNNYSAWIGALPTIAFAYTLETVFDDSPEAGKEIYLDSVMFFETLAEAQNAAEERVEARKINEQGEFKYLTVDFSDTTQLSRIVASNHTTASYNAGYGAMKLQVTGSSGDPWALINLEDLAISADEYKYIVYNSMIPTGCHQPTPEGELFYAAGDITGPTAGYSNIYSQTSDSQFHSTIVEFTNAAFWKGTVHSIRFDYYCACAIGDSQYVRSLTFCNSYEAAAAIAADRSAPTTDYRQLFYYGKYDDGDLLMSYRMYVPFDYDGVKEYPFLMLLHGAGERGTNGTYHLTGGFPFLFNDTGKSTFNNIVFAPQCPEDMKWVECDWAYGSYNLNNTPESKPLGAAISVVRKALANYRIDRDRMYVSGLSMGGYGSWDVLMRHNDMFAAGVILCGAGDPTQAPNLVNIPVRLFHGTADNIVPSRGSKQMYDAIIAAGGTKCSYTALGGYDHMIWDYVYQQQWVFDWLYQQRLSDR